MTISLISHVNIEVLAQYWFAKRFGVVLQALLTCFTTFDTNFTSFQIDCTLCGWIATLVLKLKSMVHTLQKVAFSNKIGSQFP